MSRRRSTSRVGPIGIVRAELRRFWPNDVPPADWPAWSPAGPADEFQWFTADIGPADEPAADSFQVAVATPRGLLHRRESSAHALLVERFEPAEVEHAVREFIGRCTAGSWDEVVSLLRTRMIWEYE
ncbi:hypothetical protein J0H58_22740 [bacterium]|nr:hypothetical protein [bacterium]